MVLAALMLVLVTKVVIMLHNLKKLWCIFCCKDESHIVSDIHVPRNSVNYITKDGGQGNKKWLVNMSWKSPWVIQLLHMLGLSLKLRENPYVFTLWYYNCKLSKPKFVPDTGFVLSLYQFHHFIKNWKCEQDFFQELQYARTYCICISIFLKHLSKINSRKLEQVFLSYPISKSSPSCKYLIGSQRCLIYEKVLCIAGVLPR